MAIITYGTLPIPSEVLADYPASVQYSKKSEPYEQWKDC